MEALFIFILKSGGLLAMFYFAYILLLRKETFFNSSRWFLIAGLLTSVILPFVVYTKVIWITPAPVATEKIYNNTTNLGSSAEVAPYAYTNIPEIVTEESFEINWDLVYLAIYSIGFIAFMVKFAFDFYSLNCVLKGKKIQQQEDFKFIDVNENIAPFSYFDYIVYNSSLYTATELENILEHEKVHSDQHHTIDVLISRIFCILFWFNPIVWLYKKAHNARNLRCNHQSFLSIINQKTNRHVKQKSIKKEKLLEILCCYSGTCRICTFISNTNNSAGKKNAKRECNSKRYH
jgi:hypothetical protein